jgi:hypothetical protein
VAAFLRFVAIVFNVPLAACQLFRLSRIVRVGRFVLLASAKQKLKIMALLTGKPPVHDTI